MSVSKAYAQALLEAAKEHQASEVAVNQLESEMTMFLAAVNSSHEMRVALTSPVTSSKEKVAVVQELLKTAEISPLLRQFIILVAKKGRLDLFQEVLDAFRLVRIESEGRTLGHVVSAEPIQETELEELASVFSKKLNKPIVFQSTVDPTLLAGARVTINGVTYDGTLRSQLQELRDRLVYGIKE